MKTLTLTINVTADCHFCINGTWINGSYLLDAVYQQATTGKPMPTTALRIIRALLQVLTMMRTPSDIVSNLSLEEIKP